MTPFRFISARTKVVTSSTSLQVNIPVGVRAIRIVADIPVLFWYAGMDNNTGVVLIPAGVPEYFLVQSPDSVVATAQNSGDSGNVNIALLTR